MGKKPDHISQEAWDSVNSPEITDEMFSRMRPASEVDPELVAAFKRTRGPQKAPTKKPITVRLDADIVDHYRASGKGWQKRMNADLRRALKG